MGSTTYYQTTFRARELAASVRPARETERWASMSIDERIQREPNLNRIRREIAPYLASHPDRFFGSVVVLVPQGSVIFEPIENFGHLPAAYRGAVENVGFLTIDQGEHIALDGQHRLIALREVISSKEQFGPNQHTVGDDEICVIVIEFESDKKTRTIFNKVNRHAKPTGASDNIITSEDDGFAIVTRRLLDQDLDGPFAPRHLLGTDRELVEWQRTSLTKTSTKLTTIAALYETVKDILTVNGFKHFSEKDDPIAPPEVQLADAFELASEWWHAILAMPQFQSVLSDPDVLPELRFSPIDQSALLYRPVGQISLVKGLAQAYAQARGEIDLSELVERAAQVNWSPISTNYWRDVIVRPDGRMISKKDAYELAADLLEYLVSPDTVDDETKVLLWTKWNLARGKAVGPDVADLEPEEMPQELPTPVAT